MKRQPTRIVRPPVKRMVQTRGGGRGTMFITCDNGREYEIGELAALVGISRSGLYQRIHSHGYQHEQILAPPVRPGENLNKTLYLRNHADSGSEEWRRMSSKPRTDNLARICQPGKFEQGMGER